MLEQIVRILRNRKLVFLQALVLVPLIVGIVSARQPKEYTAKANLLFRPPPTALLGTSAADSGFVDPTREAATNDALVSLGTVAELTARRLGRGITAGEVRDSVEVSASGDSDIVEIAATTRSPTLSASMANAYGEAYIDFRRNAERVQLQEAIQLVERSLARLAPNQLGGVQERALRNRLDNLRLAQALQTGEAELVQRASRPTSPSGPHTKRNVLLGVVLGGVLGFGLAALFERVDRRIKTVDQLEQVYGLPVLARVPRTGALAGLGRRALLDGTGAPLRGADSEAFRALRANLRYFNVDRPLSSILIASPTPGDGKSTVARGLALAMAEMGDNVVLVETDLHKGDLSSDLGGDEPRGLSSVLAGHRDIDDALVEVPLGPDRMAGSRRLAVLPSGPVPPNPSELLDSDRMRTVIEELEDRFELVIFDSPPISVVSDAVSLVPQVSGIVIVSGLGQTRRDAAVDFRKQLNLLGGYALGVVANLAPVERGGYYYRNSPALRA